MIYQISSGRGPVECELAVAKLLAYLESNYEISVIDSVSGVNKGDYKSVRLFSEDDLSEFLGAVLWVCQSPYRPGHKRKNWYIDFSVCPVCETAEFDESQVVYTKFHAGGKGGQNVNKVESGVRAIYLPTGEAVACTEERSQEQNKHKALARLKERFKERQRLQKEQTKTDQWLIHTNIQRGGEQAKFVGQEFRREIK